MTGALYGWPHQKERRRLEPTVAAGHAHCTETICLEERDGRTRWIRPGTPWDLAHDRHNGGYLGPAHRRCNRDEGRRHGLRIPPPAPHPPERWTL